MSNKHYHKDENGFLIRCYHNGRTLLLEWRFWVGLTVGFPLEHALWEHVWPFYFLTQWLHLGGTQ